MKECFHKKNDNFEIMSLLKSTLLWNLKIVLLIIKNINWLKYWNILIYQNTLVYKNIKIKYLLKLLK